VSQLSPRQPSPGPGGYGTASAFGSLDGWALADAQAYLGSHPDLRRFHKTGKDGYLEYIFNDGSRFHIRPNGEIIRTPKPMYEADGRLMKGFRINIYSGALVRSGSWHNLPRSEHEWVVV
jgi:hypothetical protein